MPARQGPERPADTLPRRPDPRSEHCLEFADTRVGATGHLRIEEQRAAVVAEMGSGDRRRRHRRPWDRLGRRRRGCSPVPPTGHLCSARAEEQQGNGTEQGGHSRSTRSTRSQEPSIPLARTDVSPGRYQVDGHATCSVGRLPRRHRGAGPPAPSEQRRRPSPRRPGPARKYSMEGDRPTPAVPLERRLGRDVRRESREHLAVRR